MTLQEAYEAIRKYFTRPGAVLASDGDRCVYLSEHTGAKCAVGCLIPSGLYDPGIEGMNAEEALERLKRRKPAKFAKVFGGGTEDDSDLLYLFLERAQDAHDCNSSTVEEFVLHLDRIAEYSGLDVV